MQLNFWLILSFIFLSACTSSEIKQLAIQHAETAYENDLKKEIEGVLDPQHPLYGTFLHYMVTSAEYEVEDLTKSQDDLQMAQVVVRTTPQKNRKVLAEIAAKRRLEHEAKSFNLGTALTLIQQQPGQPQGLEEKRFFLRFTKSGQGWKIEPIGSP